MENAEPSPATIPPGGSPSEEGVESAADDQPDVPIAPGGTSAFDPADPEAEFPMLDEMVPGSAEVGASQAAPASAGYPSANTTYQFQGRYRTYPRSPVGKLFYTLNGKNYVCSASLIGYKYVVTAGHCVSDGSGHWSTNVLFCPSYDSSQGGPNPAVGCWTTNLLVTTKRWLNHGEADADVGIAIYGNSGTLINQYPGDAVGWFGYAWNWSIGQHEEMFGYPSADRPATAHNSYADFNGGKIFVTSAEEAGYTIDWGTYPNSKFIGTTQTPGCSGGPWVYRYGMKYLNTWNNNWVNGVNSHLRCWDKACTDLYQEISSPQFIRGGDGKGNCTSCGVVDTIDWAFAQYP
jgi:hypothetical protein